MRQINLTERAYHNLLYNLVEMESKKTSFTDEQWIVDLKEKEEITQLINDYLFLLDGVVSKLAVEKDSNNEFPFVAVGCLVKIQDIDSKDIIKFKIIPPYKDKIQFNDVSILSPMGKALLKKTKGELIKVQAPGGEFRYKIISIHYMEQEVSIAN